MGGWKLKLLASGGGWRKEARARYASANGLVEVHSARKGGRVVGCKAEGASE